jgi:hypothetical protein
LNLTLNYLLTIFSGSSGKNSNSETNLSFMICSLSDYDKKFADSLLVLVRNKKISGRLFKKQKS